MNCAQDLNSYNYITVLLISYDKEVREKILSASLS